MTVDGAPGEEPRTEERRATDALLELLRDDLDAGFVELVARYGPVVHSVALRVSGQPFDAEDLTAEAFLRAYRALRGYSPGRIADLRPRPWLVSIVLNTWRNAVRDSARRPAFVPMPEAVEPVSAWPGVEQQAEGNETLGELVRMLAELPANHRIAVVLRHVVGLPISEVAAAMGCPEGTAKSYVSRGLQRLRAIYAITATGAGAVTRPGSRPSGTVPRARAGVRPAARIEYTAPVVVVGRESR